MTIGGSGGGIRSGLERRRGTVETARSIEGGRFTVEQVVTLLGIGEATFDVTFPVTFLEEPFVTGTLAVDENQVIVPGAFPRLQLGVLWWDKAVRADLPDAPTYRGARLIVVVDGAADTEYRSKVCWSASGRALTNPVVGGL